MREVDVGEIIWEPPADVMETTRFGAYVRWLETERGLVFQDFTALWQWSVDDLDAFWRSIWDYFEVESTTPVTEVLADDRMPGAKWFPGVGINLAGEVKRTIERRPDDLAAIGVSQTRDDVEFTNADFLDLMGRIQSGLRRLGVEEGDRVVAYLPNIPETAAAWFACAGLGVVWASAAPEFGPQAVIDRFGQLEPKVLLTVDGYRFGEKDIDVRDRVESIRHAIPSLEHVVSLVFNGREVPDTIAWHDFTETASEVEVVPVPFDHPLCVLFSSGTTGLPKPIVHGHGGIILETHKSLGLRWDCGVGDRLMFFSTTAWMMWNATVASLMCGNTIVCLDGNPMYPDQNTQWRLAEKTQTTVLGLGPPFVTACAKAGAEPRSDFELSAVRLLISGGAPMPAEAHAWIHDHFAGQAPLILGSGGTDVCTGIVEGSMLTPMYAGEMSAKSLGVAVYAYDEDGNDVVGDLGEMVITKPMPSMPVKFWGDDDMSRYRAAYFEHYPGVMRFGDWIRFTEHNSSLITGRSDATLNRGGVRIGTAEIYRVVEQMAEVDDSLIIHLEDPDGGMGELVLFVVPAGVELTTELQGTIATTLRTRLSPRHAPNSVHQIPEVPRNMTRKKLELPVKRILLGADPSTVVSRQAMINPDSLDYFIKLAGRWS